uniref:Ig-like domain-containing protein n=1 Tax=Cyprinodon variegatus TaxID=28743 RepID=A0A3Q2D654_CYPVA
YVCRILCCVSESVLISQWPRYIYSTAGDHAEINCYQNDTDYDYVYWYRQLRGGEIQLIVYLVAGTTNFEADFNSGFKAAQSQKKQWSLSIPSIQKKDEAVYLCAASLTVSQPAYFGGGTKLTVLEHDVAYPTVKVFYPSGEECRDYYRTKKRTLLCVASDFYPDHVSVSWKRNGREITNGVATDPAAKKDGEKYKISSRLKIPLEDWVDPNNEYTCIVKFYNGTHHLPYSDTITGLVTQNAKVSYTVLIVKSCVYGAFVCFLVWKLQVCPKHPCWF